MISWIAKSVEDIWTGFYAGHAWDFDAVDGFNGVPLQNRDTFNSVVESGDIFKPGYPGGDAGKVEVNPGKHGADKLEGDREKGSGFHSVEYGGEEWAWNKLVYLLDTIIQGKHSL